VGMHANAHVSVQVSSVCKNLIKKLLKVWRGGVARERGCLRVCVTNKCLSGI